MKVRTQISLRTLTTDDVNRMVTIANDKRIADTLRDIFPHPYRRSDAEGYISFVMSQNPIMNFGICYNDKLVGVCGGNALDDVHKFTAEVGYWLGLDYWGKGIASVAVTQLIEHYFTHTPFIRLQANVFSNNLASERVLIKNGLVKEGIMRKYVYKNGEYLDTPLYALLKEDWSQLIDSRKAY